MTTSYDEIRYEVSDPVATITLNRPAALNAWTATMDAQVSDAVARACADRRVVGIVITGAGRAFCAGADMNMLSGITRGETDGLTVDMPWAAPEGEFGGRMTYLMRAPKPIIAAINGPTAGMAYPLALCCDLRIVTPNTLMITSFSQRGLIAEWGLSWLLPRLVGPAVALDLLFSSRRVGGEEAVRLGLANTLVDADDLLPYCQRYITTLADNCSPTSLRVIKEQVYEQLHRGLGAAELGSQRLMLESFARPDFAEGVQSFLGKRPPRFQRLGDD